MNSQIKSLVAQHGMRKIRALIPLRPLRSIFFISYTSSSDEEVPVLCEITEDRYKVNEGYKIGFKPIQEFSKFFAQETYYQSDFDKMVERKTIKLFVEI